MIVRFLLWVAVGALALAVLLVLATVEPKEDCGHWRYTKQGPLMCKDWP